MSKDRTVLRTVIGKTVKGVTWKKEEHSVTLEFEDGFTLTLAADTECLHKQSYDSAFLCCTITPPVATRVTV